MREVNYGSAASKLFAYRWRGEEPFQVVIARPGAAPEQCTAGDGFKRFLRAIAHMPIVRELTPRLDLAQGEWAEIRIRDDTSLEPIDVMLLVPASAEAVVLAYRDRQYVVGVDAAALRTVASGCAALGAGR